jgi:hypothetical protein
MAPGLAQTARVCPPPPHPPPSPHEPELQQYAPPHTSQQAETFTQAECRPHKQQHTLLGLGNEQCKSGPSRTQALQQANCTATLHAKNNNDG